VGVQIAKRGENLQQSLVKLRFTFHLAFHLFEAEREQFESPDRINRMHRALEREMYVVHFEQQQRLVQYSQAIFPR
jgi:hypothetical protein